MKLHQAEGPKGLRLKGKYYLQFWHYLGIVERIGIVLDALNLATRNVVTRPISLGYYVIY